MPPKKNCPPVRVGVLVKVRVSFRVGGEGNQTIAPEENCTLVRVKVWVKVSFGVRGGGGGRQLSFARKSGEC